MKKLSKFNKWRIQNPEHWVDAPPEDQAGAFAFKLDVEGPGFLVLATAGDGWDHVSVSTQHRCPTWAEMDRIYRIFFRPEEVAMQLHLPTADHINVHSYCLHLWRPWGTKRPIPLPPKEFV